MLGVSKVRQIICPVREVEREVLITLLPDISDLFVAVNDQTIEIDCFAPCS